MSEDSADANGTVKEGNQTVIYIYKSKEDQKPETKKTGNVYVKYITEGGKVLEAESTVKENAPVGEDYKTVQKTFKGYEFVRMGKGSAEANGKVVESDLHVVYVYKKSTKPSNPDNNNEKPGDNNNKPGDNQGGNTGEEPNKNPETFFIDEFGNKIAMKLSGLHVKENISGYEYVNTTTDKNGNKIHHYKKNPNTVTKFVDKNGKEISLQAAGFANRRNLAGYRYLRSEIDSKGNTSYVYEENADAETKFVDENGKEIDPTVLGDKDKKDIKGYEFVRTEVDSMGNTKHIYKEVNASDNKPQTYYVDEDGNVIADKENGEQSKKNIPGYEFVKTEKDKDGNVKHIYKKNDKAVTKYVDEDGKEISKSDMGIKDHMDIEGYEFTGQTSVDEHGNVTHIYKKKASGTLTPSKETTTSFVDENGNVISSTVKGNQPKKDISGYEYVRTEKDKDGNVNYIYRKLNTSHPTSVQVGKTIGASKSVPRTGVAGVEGIVAILATAGAAYYASKKRK